MMQETTNLLDVYLQQWTIVCYIKHTYPVMILSNILFVNKVSTFMVMLSLFLPIVDFVPFVVFSVISFAI